MIRGSIMQVKGMEYIEAATAINASDKRIILKHIMPNAISPLIVQMTMGIGGAILMAYRGMQECILWRLSIKYIHLYLSQVWRLQGGMGVSFGRNRLLCI